MLLSRDVLRRRAQFCGCDCLVHLFEVVARADVDSLDANLLVKDERDGNGIGGAGEHADLRDDAAHADGAQRARKRADAADFDDEIDAFAVGLFKDPAVPLGGFSVVEAGVEAEGTCALELGFAR